VREQRGSGSSEYFPNLALGTQVRLMKREDRNSGRIGKIIVILPNPSKRSERQWYDVKFDNGRSGRFRELDLERAVS
jgi:hypothetical protein